MSGISTYLLSITAAAIMCAVIRQIAGHKSTTEKIIKIITGVFMSVTLVAPLIDFNIGEVEEYFSEFKTISADAAEAGTEIANKEIAEIIKQQTEAYILDEAQRLGLEIDVEVKLSESKPAVPSFVVLKGTVSPYQKHNLGQHISDYLGISQENQQWI